MPILQKSDIHKQIPDIIRSLSNKWGEDFYHSMTASVAEVLDADYTFIARVSNDGIHAKTLAFYNKAEILENLKYPLAGSPCEQVTSNGSCTSPALMDT